MDGLDLRRDALHAALLASDSATAVLERIFGAPIHVRRLSPDDVLDGAAFPVLEAVGERIVTRHVELLCGDTVASEATLAYLPRRLPPALAEELAATERPFGRVLRELGLRRATLAARLCDAGEAFALEHRALLCLPDGRRLALVEEHYSWALFSGS